MLIFNGTFLQLKSNKHVIFLVFGLMVSVLVALPWLQVWLMDTGFHGRWLDTPAADFMLSSEVGKQISLAQFSGRYVYLYFGYLHCDGYCQAQMVTLFLLGQALSTKPVSMLFVTLDPARDTAEQLPCDHREFSFTFVSCLSARIDGRCTKSIECLSCLCESRG